jgi:hypothetical protein
MQIPTKQKPVTTKLFCSVDLICDVVVFAHSKVKEQKTEVTTLVLSDPCHVTPNERSLSKTISTQQVAR